MRMIFLKKFNQNKIYLGKAIKPLYDINNIHYEEKTKKIVDSFKKLVCENFLPCADEIELHSDRVDIGEDIVFGKISKFCKPKEALNVAVIHLHIASKIKLKINNKGRVTSNESIIYGEYIRNNEKDRYIVIFSIESSHGLSNEKVYSFLKEYEDSEKVVDNMIKKMVVNKKNFHK